jgi:hypothetical protein
MIKVHNTAEAVKTNVYLGGDDFSETRRLRVQNVETSSFTVCFVGRDFPKRGGGAA